MRTLIYFSLVKIFFRIQIFLQFIKQTINWNATVFVFNFKRCRVFFKFKTLEIGIFKSNKQSHHFITFKTATEAFISLFKIFKKQNKKNLQQE